MAAYTDGFLKLTFCHGFMKAELQISVKDCRRSKERTGTTDRNRHYLIPVFSSMTSCGAASRIPAELTRM